MPGFGAPPAVLSCRPPGGVAERLNAPVLKAGASVKFALFYKGFWSQSPQLAEIVSATLADFRGFG
jgi:hypothetical protein